MPNWVDAGDEAVLRDRGRRVFKSAGKQILLVVHGDRIHACNNRCPHQGYPLSEGTLGEGCTLTCNWHNWKFSLATGETLVGGDQIRLYPVRLRDGRVFVDVTDAPAAARQSKALASLAAAVEDNDYDRMARDIARFLKAGGDALEPLRQTITSRADRFEYGMTHAFGAAPDWIELHDAAGDEARRLVALVEPIAHIAWDTLREPARPFTQEVTRWDEYEFARAIEREDEAAALGCLNAALSNGQVSMLALKCAFAKAALAHYQDFGHSAIYTVKAFALIEGLGGAVARQVLSSLVRSIIFASREDRIPEFRHYAVALKAFGARAERVGGAGDFIGNPVPATLDRIATMREDPLSAYRLLLEASATKNQRMGRMSSLIGAVTVASTLFGLMLGQITVGAELFGVLIGAGVLMTVRT